MALVKKQSNKIKNLEREISCIEKRVPAGARDATLCANFKKEGYHQPQDCYKMEKNKDMRPTGWRSTLWRWGTEVNNKLSTYNNDPLTHTANFSPTVTSSQYKSTIQATGIIDSGTTYIYFSDDAHIVNIYRSTPKFTVGTATGQKKLHRHRRVKTPQDSLWIPSHRAYHVRVQTYLNSCRPSM